jgi:pimeloyl-ACP methyl ester carboxylesterase
MRTPQDSATKALRAANDAVVAANTVRSSRLFEGGSPVSDPQRSTSTRSPVLAILASLAAGAVLAVALILGPASGGSEPLITGSVLFAFGLGWGLMAFLSTRYSAQPQTWMMVPAMFLGITGLGLIVFQPGPAAMDLLSWIWPPALAILAVWMIAQVRSNLHGRGRWLVVPVIATLLLVAVGGGLVTVSAATGRTAQSGSGQMIDVGGHRLYIECIGSGSPTVVLQAGLGASSSSWTGIVPNVAASTTVCAYDRAGHGRSEEAAGPQDGIALATDLHTLLERAGVAGPYVLVGHSSGGPYVRVFADRYPDQVAGMVLLDAQPPDAFTALPDYPGFYEKYRFATALAPSLARVGLLGPLLGLPADQASPSAARSARDAVAVLPIALQQAQALTTIEDRPLIVVTAASAPDAGWLEAQDRMTRLSTDSVHRVIETATHDSLVSGVDAAASTQAIMDVVESIRAGTALQ